MSATVGSKAPDFTLVNQDREPVRLADQIGSANIVLAFFPAAFSGTCTKEMCTLRDSMSQLNSLGAKVYGISTDTFFSLKALDVLYSHARDAQPVERDHGQHSPAHLDGVANFRPAPKAAQHEPA